jgi:hypothetical protein
MGRLELPLPELGRGGKKDLEGAAKEMQRSIRERVPADLKNTIVVKTYKTAKGTGIAVEYDDRAENFVYAAIEYPRLGRSEKSGVTRE